MKMRLGWCVLVGLTLVAGRAGAEPTPAAGGPARPGAAPIEDLGGGRYRIGSIEVDKPGGRFTVPGRVLRLDPPLEYLAVARGGVKAYESLLELDADGIQFNLACVLIGLDPQKAGRPEFQFDREVIEGDAVRVHAAWQAESGPQRWSLAEVLATAAAPGQVSASGVRATDDWVYTGSYFAEDGSYMAQQIGSLISFIHDPTAVIDHRTGVGIGQYGSVAGNKDLPWAVGTAVTLTVERAPP